MRWLPEPPDGSQITLGFDGSDVSDWSVIAAETVDGFSFTPRYGPDKRPTIWNPAEWDGKVPREQVDLAIDELHDRFKVERGYYDPPRWETDVDRWALKHGERTVVAFPTYKTVRMHEALERFYADLTQGRIKQDGCPLTDLAMSHARKIPKGPDRYILGKPSQHQKIDPVMGRVLAHEAGAHARQEGWGARKPRKQSRLIVVT